MKLPSMMRNALREELTAKNSNVRLVALGSTEPYAAWLKLMIPHLGLSRPWN